MTARRSFLTLAALVSLFAVSQPAASQTTRTARLLTALGAGNGSSPFRGDRPSLTTICPNGDGFRDRAIVRFILAADASVDVKIVRTKPGPKTVYAARLRLSAGRNRFVWAPPAETQPRTYLLRLTVSDVYGRRQTYGALRARDAQGSDNVVIRVQGVDAAFGRASYRPGETASAAISTDAKALSMQVFHAGPEAEPTTRNDAMSGVPITEPVELDWAGRRNARSQVKVPVGHWQSGLYFARFTAADGRVGYAPFVVSPARLGTHRLAVVLPTNTWQAYNFQDENGDGWGDTWYAAWTAHTARLGRPFLDRGVPPHFRGYDLPFLRFMARTGREADYLSDADLDRAASSRALARNYDAIVFPGHHEYVSAREYALVAGYRDLGGNLAFLSANNFFWKVVEHGPVLERIGQWRDLGRPEAALIGAQYRGNDEGERRGPFVVRGAAAAPWLFAGTGLTDGSSFGQFGIEIDATSAASPRGTIVLAEIPHLYGPAFTAQMTYYETAAGSKVFAAGAFTLAGSADHVPVRRLLENLFDRLARP